MTSMRRVLEKVGQRICRVTVKMRAESRNSHYQQACKMLYSTDSNCKTIVVEGNIGSGKTTFLKYFQKLPSYSVLDEPVDRWRDCQGHNLLDLMYRDPKRWSLCFQSYVQMTMLDLHTKPVNTPYKIMERSLFSAKYCFVNNLRDNGLMSEASYAVLNEWFKFITQTIPLDIDRIVYLKTDPEVVYERIAKRGRCEEEAITLDYLKSIHDYHEAWLTDKKFGPTPQVIVIDANEDMDKMFASYQRCDESIQRSQQRIAVAN